MIEKFTDEQLKDELERRQKKVIESGKPVQLDIPDLTDLRNACQEYIDDIAINHNRVDEDWPHWIYEAAMIALYGENVFRWINENDK